MIELNKSYSTKQLANDGLSIAYSTFRGNRKEYEQHLSNFYLYSKTSKGNTTYYTFIEQKATYMPYKEYKKLQKNNTLKQHIKDTIYYDNRQTGSNIARIIYVNGEIQALNLELSTLSVYVREQLRELVDKGYYLKEDYRWCVLDKKLNKYNLMSDKEIERLRSFFYTRQDEEAEENILAEQEEGNLSVEEATQAIGELMMDAYMKGRFHYQAETGKWPLKVPVYTINGFMLNE